MAGAAAIVLAAGRGQRFGGDGNKLLASLDGLALVRRVVETALASDVAPVVVVTGYAAGPIASALSGLAVEIVHNPDHETGMASSLAVGVATLSPSVAGALILLGDMPLVRADTLDRLLDAFTRAAPNPDAVVPTFEGRGGNPVLLGRSMFADLAALEGDEGARRLLTDNRYAVAHCPVGDAGILTDVDTPDALRALRGRL